MLLKTKHFGEMEVDEKGIINFGEGLPGFQNMHRFILLNTGKEDSPFRWLQSVDESDLAFATVDPFAIRKDYNFELNEPLVSTLGIETEDDILILSIVVVPKDISKMTMNLKAPVVINTKNKKGVQVILDTNEYGVRHYILEELRRQEVDGNVGSHKEEGSVDSNK
ncbi:MAG: flagellar assembly protein FliW [Bacillota bacterium]|nr:flagellar assembly protein FliW [Bacillota bacterium]